MKSKKIVIPLFAVLAAVVLLFSCKTGKGAGNKVEDLNVLLITLDTTRADHIGAYGHSSIKTPNIDELCSKGVMFQNCYSPVPLTLPAHCSIFTGKYSIGHGVRNNSNYSLQEDEAILTRLLKQKGYHTYAVVAAFVLISKFGLNQGFDIYDDSFSQSEIPADVVYRNFKNWFEENHRKKFFSWVHFYDPHDPYDPPAEYIEKGSENDDLKLYAGEIEFVDKYVGKIIEDLKSSGILNKTLIIIVGDHGEAFGEHNEYGHSIFCYEENLKVPLIFYNEKIFEKKRITKRVNLVDMMPTILDLLAIQIPGEVQGESFLPMMRGKEEEGERTFYVESMYGKEVMNWAPLTGIIEGDYKYISLPQPELYNLKNDKDETNNIFKKEFNAAKKYDGKLKELILKLAGPTSTGEAKRKLSQEDVKHLTSLGYLFAFSSKAKKGSIVDPKTGVIVDNKLKKYGEKIKKGEDLENIETELKKFLLETPELKSPLVYTHLHDIYKKKDLSSALEILEEGINEFPDIYQFRFRLASFLYELKKYDEVIEHCRLILKQNPLSAKAYTLLGNVYFQQNNPEEAIRNFREAVTLEPEIIPVKMRYADILMRYKRFNEAVEVYNSLLDKDNAANNHDFLFKVAMLNAQYGSMDMAEKIFDRLIKIKSCGKYHFFYAIILSKNRKIPAAIKSMETALNQYPGELTPNQQQQAIAALKVWRSRYNP